jgi:hypothetical protein
VQQEIFDLEALAPPTVMVQSPQSPPKVRTPNLSLTSATVYLSTNTSCSPSPGILDALLQDIFEFPVDQIHLLKLEDPLLCPHLDLCERVLSGGRGGSLLIFDFGADSSFCTFLGDELEEGVHLI